MKTAEVFSIFGQLGHIDDPHINFKLNHKTIRPSHYGVAGRQLCQKLKKFAH